MTKGWTWGWVLGGLAYVAAIGWMSQPLFFFWDEWSVLWGGWQSPAWGLLESNGGNFFPLGRAFFLFLAHTFGNWYLGYVLVSAALAWTTVFVLARSLDRPTVTHRILLACLGAVFLGCSGVLFAVGIGFMIVWVLAVLLAVLAFSVVRHAQTAWRTALALGLLLLSGLVFASSAIPLSLLVAALLLYTTPVDQWVWRRREGGFTLWIPVASVAIGVAVSLAATFIVRFFPSIDPVSNVITGLLGSESSIPWSERLWSGLAALASWIAAPLTYFPLVDRNWLMRSIFGFLDHPSVLLIVLVPVAVALALAFWGVAPARQPKAFFHRPHAASLARAGVFGWVLIGFVALLLVVRPDGLATIRYMTVWLIPAVLFWVSLVDEQQRGFLRLARFVVVGVITIVGGLMIVLLPHNFVQVTDLERPRMQNSPLQVEALRACREGGGQVVKEVAPTMNVEVACGIYLWLEDESLLGRMTNDS